MGVQQKYTIKSLAVTKVGHLQILLMWATCLIRICNTCVYVFSVLKTNRKFFKSQTDVWRNEIISPFKHMERTLIEIQGARENTKKETKSERLHKQNRKAKVQEKRVAEETHLVYDSLCQRKWVEMNRTSGHDGSKCIKAVIHGIILKLNVPVEDDIAMPTASWTFSVRMYGAYMCVQMMYCI